MPAPTSPPAPATGPLPGSLRQLVAQRYSALTPAEQHVAEAVLRRPRQVVSLSIEALARELDVAPTVISRFAGKLGTGGFRAIRLRLAEELGAERTATGAPDGAAGDTGGASRPWAVARASLLEDIAILQRHVYGVDPAALTAAAHLLAAAQRVVTLGGDASGAVARRLASMLARRGWRALAVVTPTDHTWANDVAPPDLLVVVSHRGQVNNPVAGFLPAVRTVRERGAAVLVVTNAASSPLARLATVVLATCLPADLTDDAYVFGAAFPVQVVLIRALVAAALAAREDLPAGVVSAPPPARR